MRSLPFLLTVCALGLSARADPAPPAPAAAGEPAVRLVDAGREPRRTLRLAPRAGDRQDLSISMAVSVGMAFGDRPVTMRELPPIILPFTVMVARVRPGGEIETEFRCGRVEVRAVPGTDPVVAGMMQAVLAGVEGVRGTALLSPRGLTLESGLTIPENMDPGAKVVLEGLREAAGQIAFPLPEEPVGAGARWEVVSRLPGEAGSAEQKAAWTLVELDGDRFTVTSASAIRAGEGLIRVGPGQEPLRRRSLESISSAVLKGRFAQVAPAESVLESSIVERIEVRPNVVMTRSTAVKSRVGPAPDSSAAPGGR